MSRIIKSGTDSKTALEVMVQPITLNAYNTLRSKKYDPEEESRQAVERAEQQANLIKSTARAEADAVRAQAWEAGYQEGLRHGAGTVDDLVARLESEISSIEEAKANLLDLLEPEVLKLCVQIVEKIIRHEAKTDPRVTMRVIKSCLKRIRDCDEVCVRVSPEELEEIKACRDELMSSSEGIKSVRVVDDRRVSPGGCVVESASGDFDARIETQLGKISAKMEETYENGRGGAGSELESI